MISDYKESGIYKENAQRGRIGAPLTDNVPVPQVNVCTELADLGILVARAHEIFTILEEKTRLIRYPVPQCQEKEPNEAYTGSEIRATIADQNQRLRALLNRMSTMIDEIDL